MGGEERVWGVRREPTENEQRLHVTEEGRVGGGGRHFYINKTDKRNLKLMTIIMVCNCVHMLWCWYMWGKSIQQQLISLSVSFQVNLESLFTFNQQSARSISPSSPATKTPLCIIFILLLYCYVKPRLFLYYPRFPTLNLIQTRSRRMPRHIWEKYFLPAAQHKLTWLGVWNLCLWCFDRQWNVGKQWEGTRRSLIVHVTEPKTVKLTSQPL